MLMQKNGATRTGNVIPLSMWGDSRCRGFGSSNPTATSWSGLLAASLPPYFTTQIHGVDGDTLFAHSSTPSLRAAFTASVAAFVGSAPKSTLIIQYDINDWSNGELATDYGSFLTAQLTSFQAIAGLTVVVFASIDYQNYALTNPTSGNTMSDFLTQQTNAVAAHSATSVLVLGKPMITFGALPNQYFDTIHPNDAGYQSIRNAIAPLVTDL